MNEKYFDVITLAVRLGCEVREREPLSAHCTFRTGGDCDVFVEVSSDDALGHLMAFLENASVRYFVLGNGSNVLFSDDGFEGVILHIGSMMNEIRLMDDTTIYAQAGASLTRLCNFALENSLTGLEFAYGIPGYVGGAVFMNAGAYGGEIRTFCKAPGWSISRAALRLLMLKIWICPTATRRLWKMTVSWCRGFLNCKRAARLRSKLKWTTLWAEEKQSSR